MSQFKNIVHFTAILLFVLVSAMAKGQKIPNSHQYFTHLPFVNPAAMSEKNSLNGTFIHRSRWTGFADAGNTQFLDVNMPIHMYNSNVGITVVSDRLGVNFNNTINLNYSYKFQVDRSSFLSFGISPTFTFIGARYSEIQTDFENDPQFMGGDRQAVLPNVRFGAFYYKQNFYAGISMPQLLSPTVPNISTGEEVATNTGDIFEPSDMPVLIMAGIERQLNANWGIEPNAMVRMQPNAPLQLDLNTMFRFRHQMGLGIGYRSKSTFHFYANYLINRDWKVGYSYGYNAGDIATFQSGNHEIMLQYGAVNYKRERVNLPRKIQRYRKQKERDRKRKERKRKRWERKNKSEDGKGSLLDFGGDDEGDTSTEEEEPKEESKTSKEKKSKEKKVKEDKPGKDKPAKEEKEAKEKKDKEEKEKRKRDRKKKEIKIDEEKPEKKRQPY